MGSIRLTATVVAISLALSVAVSSVSAQSQDSAKVSNTSPGVADEAFAGYQRVGPGITAPKATRSPDPEYPDVPADVEPRGVVVMLIGVDTRGHVGPVQVVAALLRYLKRAPWIR